MMARVLIVLAAVLVALLAAAGAWMYSAPAPKIIIVTGTRNLAYYKFGEEYAKALKLQHRDVRVLPTSGSLDNLALLDPRSYVIRKLIQRGVIGADDAATLRDPESDGISKLRQRGIISADDAAALRDPQMSVIGELIQRRIMDADTAAMLRDPKASVIALIQGGIINAGDASDLESLGTVFYEPLWLFRRRDAGNDAFRNLREKRDATRIETKACSRGRHGIIHSAPREGINGLRGQTIAIGPNGSGIQPLACELLGRHGITRGVSNLRPKETGAAIDALLDGTIDAAFVVASWDAPGVQKLLHNSDVELVGYPQADAYADRYSYLHKVMLHRGAIDLAGDKPQHDMALIATKASLIVRRDLPLPIQYLLLNAARQIHGQRNVLQATGEFPAAEAAFPPLSAAAQQFYKQGVPYYLNSFLMTYLPFSIAEQITEQIDKVITALFLIGTVGFLFPLARLFPVLYNWVTQRPVFRLLFDVLALEAELAAPGGREHVETIALRLDGLEKRANNLLRRRVPASLAAALILRQHIDGLREQLRRHISGGE
jgi:TRAP-type uncharacterized transport system substrate-binding protein